MICPICGREIPEEKPVCNYCGTDFAILVESLLPPPYPEPERPKKRRSRLLIAVTAGAALLLSICLFAGLLLTHTPKMQSGYVRYQQHILAGRTEKGLSFAVNGEALPISANGQINMCQTSLDGSTFSFLSDTGLSIVQEASLHSFQAAGTTDYLLSANGKAILYRNDLTSGTIQLYRITEDKSYFVAAHTGMLDWCISPNGKYAAFTRYDAQQKQVVLMLYDGSLRQIASNIHEIHGISDDGKYIYASRRNGDADRQLYCLTLDGNKTALANHSGSVYLNADHRQILFFNQDGSFISTCGRKPAQIGSVPLSPLMPPNTQAVENGSKITLPAFDLYGQVYLTAESKPDAYFIDKDSPRKLAQAVDYCTLDDSGSYFYYLADGKVYFRSAAATNATETVLAEDVLYNRFALSSDRSWIAYVSNDGICKRCGWKPSAPEVLRCFDIDPAQAPVLMFDPDNLLYCINQSILISYLQDGSIVFSMDVQEYTYTPNRLLYILSIGILYPQGQYFIDASYPKLLWKPENRLEFT